ncbi:MAG: sulfite exporter TauE/SafE family protein [Bacteroidales bacterium]|nr:sulfite exporter TauE/SafE family protein [Bacteroidales bacterium]
MTDILFIFLLSLAGAFVLRVCGFGFGVFTMAWFPYLLPSYGEATTLSGILAMCGSIIVTIKNWHHIDWKKLTPILITFIVSSCASIHFITLADDRLLKRILGVTLIIAAIWFLVISKHVKVKPTLTIQITMGTISGVMGGLFAMHGPAAVLYFLACSKDKDEYVALTMSYLLLGNIMMLGFRINNGFLTQEVGYAFLYGIVAVAIGTWIGAKVFKHMSTDLVKQISYAYIAISGIISLIMS